MSTSEFALRMPVAKLNEATLNRSWAGSRFCADVLEFYGIFLLEGLFDSSTIEEYKRKFFDELRSGLVEKNTLHLTEYNLAPDSTLHTILAEAEFLNIIKNFFSGNVGLYNIRIIAKLDSKENNVFLHQDSCYHFGSDQKYSFFVPLTACSSKNGGLVFVPGSHKFGFMGDAGALKDIYPSDLSLVCPELEAGDLVIMNSHMWHRSATNFSSEPRIYFDIHIMDSRAPFSRRALIGEDYREYSIDNYNNDAIFSSSRYQRLRPK